jgi:hypothetical protein
MFLFKRKIVRKQNIATWIGHGKPVVRQRQIEFKEERKLFIHFKIKSHSKSRF